MSTNMQFGEYDFRTFTFGKGSHPTRENGMCVMEAVAYVSGEKHSDSPKCACPVISTFMRTWNDSIIDDDRRRELLTPFVFRLPGTKADPTTEYKRPWMAFDWLVREFLPAFLELSDVTASHAAGLRSLDQINEFNFDLSAPLITAAGAAARAAAWAAAGDAARAAAGAAARAAARDAARAAAWAAAGDAARAAAGAAARAAARAAAGAAARAAAGAAAGDAAGAAAGAAAGDAAGAAARAAARAAAGAAVRAAAGAAARDALTPTVFALQESASRLVDRMISLTEPKESGIRKNQATTV